MKFEVDNQQLIAYHNELLEMNNSILAILLRSRKGDFLKANQSKIATCLADRDAINRKFFKADDKGNWIYPEIVSPDIQSPNPIINDGLTIEDYNKEMITFLKSKVTLFL